MTRWSAGGDRSGQVGDGSGEVVGAGGAGGEALTVPGGLALVLSVGAGGGTGLEVGGAVEVVGVVAEGSRVGGGIVAGFDHGGVPARDLQIANIAGGQAGWAEEQRVVDQDLLHGLAGRRRAVGVPEGDRVRCSRSPGQPTLVVNGGHD